MRDLADDLANLNVHAEELSVSHELQTADQKRLLDTIDALRDYDVGSFTDLPQLIVCGIQSAGKSSVLEAISGVPFPRDVSTCTRFATEVALRRDPVTSVTVSILPHDREGKERDKLLQFKHVLNSYDEFPSLVTKASEAMGLSDPGRKKRFSKDRLKVEVTGPTQPQLTLVDLPGLIASSDDEDMQLVEGLVEDYMRNSRAIILAVVKASTDAENQSVLRLAKKLDKNGRRTMGILTKPDLLENMPRKEADWRAVTRNERFTFELGWHILRNVDSGRAGSNREERLSDRDRIEAEYFATSNFKAEPSRKLGVGIVALRERLSKELFQQIKKHLPTLIKDIKVGLEQAKEEISKLGGARVNEAQQRDFLMNLSKDFTYLCRDAIRGVYDDKFFKTMPNSKLCADILNAHEQFARDVDDRGKAWKIVKDEDEDEENGCIARDTMTERIRGLLDENRGIELRVQINPAVIGTLFSEYSSPWKKLAYDHLKSQYDTIAVFLYNLLDSLAYEETRDRIYVLWMREKLEGLLNTAKVEVKKILEVYSRPPMTANPLFYKRIYELQRKKHKDEDEAEDEVEDDSGADGSEAEDDDDEVDPLKSTAELALEAVQAYYDTTIYTFVDNILTLCIWAPMIMQLEHIFSPTTVGSMKQEEVRDLAAESEEKQAYRAELERKLVALENGLRECGRYSVPLPANVRPITPVPKIPQTVLNGANRTSGSHRPSSTRNSSNATGFGASSTGPSRNGTPVGGPAPSTQGGGLFAQNTGAPSNTSALFGGGGFGVSSNGSSRNGTPVTVPTAGAQGGGLFGQNTGTTRNTTASFGGGGFGSGTNRNTSNGASGQPAASPTPFGGFGAPRQGGGLFGNAALNGQQGGNGFGFPNRTATAESEL